MSPLDVNISSSFQTYISLSPRLHSYNSCIQWTIIPWNIFCLVISEEVRGACAGFYVIQENQHSRVILSGSFPTITKISTWAKIQSYSPSYQIKTRLSFVGINSSPRCDWKNLHPVQFMGIATE